MSAHSFQPSSILVQSVKGPTQPSGRSTVRDTVSRDRRMSLGVSAGSRITGGLGVGEGGPYSSSRIAFSSVIPTSWSRTASIRSPSSSRAGRVRLSYAPPPAKKCFPSLVRTSA